MVTIYKLNKLTTKQLNKLHETVDATRGNRCKAEAFALAVAALAKKQVEQPKSNSNIARVYSYNFGTRTYPDFRDAFITCGKFIGYSSTRETVVTTYNQHGISAGQIINLTDAAMTQLQNEFGKLIF